MTDFLTNMASDNKVYLVTIGIGLVIFIVIHVLNERIDKKKKDVRECGARMKEKATVTGEDGRETYYASFTLISGEVVTLPVSHRVYRELPDSGYGNLRYGANSFLSFTVKGITVEA